MDGDRAEARIDAAFLIRGKMYQFKLEEVDYGRDKDAVNAKLAKFCQESWDDCHAQLTAAETAELARLKAKYEASSPAIGAQPAVNPAPDV